MTELQKRIELKKSMSQKLRMDGRDYSRPGWYFVTLGADYHHHFFGSVVGGEMRPDYLGAADGDARSDSYWLDGSLSGRAGVVDLGLSGRTARGDPCELHAGEPVDKNVL